MSMGLAVEQEFEPVILALACNWCSYAGADLAGISRCQYPTNVRIIRVMCSGMVHPNLVMLQDFGIEEERFKLAWVSASEGPQFAKLMTEFTEQIKRLGPSPYKS